RKASLSLLLVTALVLVLLVVASGSGALTNVSPKSSTPASPPESTQAALGAVGSPESPEVGGNYTISLEGTAPVALSPSGSETKGSAGTGAAAFVNSLLASHETVCFAAGDYILSSDILVRNLRGVTLSFDP